MGSSRCASPSPTRSSLPPERALLPCADSPSGCFQRDGPDRSEGKQIWLVYGTRHESEMYYREEFEATCRTPRQLPLSAHAEPWRRRAGPDSRLCAGTRGPDHRGARCRLGVAARPRRRLTHRLPAAELRFDIYALCLRAEPHDHVCARAAEGPRLAPQADRLRALRLILSLRVIRTKQEATRD